MADKSDPRRRGGRLSKKTPERVTRLTDALKAGNTRVCSCAVAGIGVSTFHEWLHADPEFAEAVTRAEAECEARNVALVSRAATEHPVVTVKRWIGKDGKVEREETTTRTEFDWQAAAWWLERRRPDDYKPRSESAITGSIDVIERAAEEAESAFANALKAGRSGASVEAPNADAESGDPL